jgi:hypothetical protein
LFPRLEILSVARFQGPDDEGPDRIDASHRNRQLEITLFKAVTVGDLQSVTLHFKGNSNDTCLCFFGAQLNTSLDSGCIRACHVESLAVFPGAGILAPAGGIEAITHGQGMRFDMTIPVRLDMQEPADESLARSTFSIVLELTRVAQLSGQRQYDALCLWCESRVLEFFHDAVSLHHFSLCQQLT